MLASREQLASSHRHGRAQARYRCWCRQVREVQQFRFWSRVRIPFACTEVMCLHASCCIASCVCGACLPVRPLITSASKLHANCYACEQLASAALRQGLRWRSISCEVHQLSAACPVHGTPSAG